MEQADRTAEQSAFRIRELEDALRSRAHGATHDSEFELRTMLAFERQWVEIRDLRRWQQDVLEKMGASASELRGVRDHVKRIDSDLRKVRSWIDEERGRQRGETAATARDIESRRSSALVLLREHPKLAGLVGVALVLLAAAALVLAGGAEVLAELLKAVT